MKTGHALLIAFAILLAGGLLVLHQQHTAARALALQEALRNDAARRDATLQDLASEVKVLHEALQTLQTEKLELAKTLAALQEEVLRRPLPDDGVSPVPVLSRLADHENASVQGYALRLLGYLGGKEAEEALLATLKRPGAEDRASVILEALGRMESQKLPAVIEELLARGAPKERQAAANILSNNRNLPVTTAMVDSMLELLKTARGTEYNDRYARQYASAVLARSADPRACEGILLALKLSRDEDAYQQRQMIQALATCARGQPTEASWLCQALRLQRPSLKRGTNELPSHYLIPGIGALGDQRATPALLPFLRSANTRELEDAVLAIGHLRDPLAAEALASAWSAAEGETRKQIEAVLLQAYPGVRFDEEKKTWTVVDKATLDELLAKRKQALEAVQPQQDQGVEGEQGIF